MPQRIDEAVYAGMLSGLAAFCVYIIAVTPLEMHIQIDESG